MDDLYDSIGTSLVFQVMSFSPKLSCFFPLVFLFRPSKNAPPEALVSSLLSAAAAGSSHRSGGRGGRRRAEAEALQRGARGEGRGGGWVGVFFCIMIVQGGGWVVVMCFGEGVF